MTGIRGIVQQTAPFIILYSVIELLAGGTLRAMTESISLLPGLLILVPPLLDMRGNISSALGARLSSGIHLGYIKSDRVTPDLKTNIGAALMLNLFFPIVLAFLAWFTFALTGLPCMSPLALVVICLVTGLGSGIVLTLIAVFVASVSYRKGLDPDNVTTPSISCMGDITTVIILFLIVKLVAGLGI